MSFRPSSLAQPLLTLAAFGAGASAATASARLEASGASASGVWATSAAAAAAFVAASWLLARPKKESSGGADKRAPSAEDDIERAVLDPATETERSADEDWRAVARDGDGLRKLGVGVGDMIAED